MKGLGSVVTAAAALACALGSDANAARARDIDPVGNWSCVVYGRPELGEERIGLQFSADGSARLARGVDDRARVSTPLPPWRIENHELRFTDPRTGRGFTADLRRASLRGGWRTQTAIGGWSCSAAAAPAVANDTRSQQRVAPLVPRSTATPIYPARAIRGARQGRVVACFLVAADGTIVEPTLLEISDEIFREPVLDALRRSRYEPWHGDGERRGSCRTYTFDLDSLLRSEP